MIWIGFAAAALLAATGLMFTEARPGPALLLNVALLTIGVYSMRHPRQWQRMLASLSLLLAGVSFCWLPPAQQIAIVLPAFLWWAYYGFRRPGHNGLRALPGWKPLVVAFVWSWVTVLLPAPWSYWPAMSGLFLSRFLFVGALALAYDLVDLEYDRARGLPTLARYWGLACTLWVVVISLALATTVSFIDPYQQAFAGRLCRSNACTVVLILCLFHPVIPDRYRPAGHWQKMIIDGMMVLQWLFLCVG